MILDSHGFWLGTPRRRRPGASIGHVPDPADRKGREVLPRPPGHGAGVSSRRCFQLPLLLLSILCLAHIAAAQLDTFYLRNGTTLAGNVVGETSDAYRTLIQTPTAPMLTNVPVRAVRYVVYGTPQKARANLDLDRVARMLNARDTATVRFLPTEAFGVAVQETVQSARSRIWILAYYISGGGHETIQAIYNTVRGKARTGLDTLVISEFGKSTPMPIRNATLNYAQTLQDDGIKIRFVQEYRTMHKKVILVDRDKVLLGSANLTGVGVSYSDECSVLIQSEPFARNVEADIGRIVKQSMTIDHLEF
jgi:phosphatidylserine/phosphatidylglycerophosphate/cardiolipin synthase-like enzyme